MAALLIGSCGKSSKQHAEEATEKINEAGGDLKEAVLDGNEEAKMKATEDWQKFKIESEREITAMENQTKELEQKISKAGKKEKMKLRTALDKADQKLKEEKEKLKQRNTEFEADLTKFDDSVIAKNDSFKREFKHDMNELGTSFKDLFKDNVK